METTKTLEKPATGCCPRFDPEPWHEKVHFWKDKPFMLERVRCFLHVPLNFGAVVTRAQERIRAAGAGLPGDLRLSDEVSLWRSDLYLAVSRPVPGARMAALSGTFLSRVYEGPYNRVGEWAKDMREFVMSRGKQIRKLYFFYTTCPKCAKAYGENYVVLIAQAE